MPQPGRPPIYPPRLSDSRFRVTPAHRSELQRVAEEQGTTISSIVRELIHERAEDGRPFPGRKISTTWDDDDA